MRKILLKIPWLIPTVVFAILVILGARAHPLWIDESETALFARNILKYGIPKGWDGVNIISLRSSEVLNTNLVNNIIPWAPLYLAAASFALFGQSAFTARIPFIFMSIITMPLLYYLVIKLTKSVRIAFFTVLIACLSVPYIMFAYQARYYSLAIFAGLLFIYGALRLREASIYPILIFLFGGVLSIYNNYISFPLLFLSLFLGLVIIQLIQKKEWSEIKNLAGKYLLLGFIIFATFIPWYLYFQPHTGRGSISPTFPSFYNFVSYLYYDILEQFLLSNFLPLGLILISTILYKKGNRDKIFSLLLLLITSLFYFLLIAVVTLIIDISPSIESIRYHVVLFPVLIVSSAIILDSVFEYNKYLFGIVFVLYIFTNVLTFNPPFEALIPKYIGEMTNPYPVSSEKVADYLKENAKKGDTAFVNIDRYNEPLIFLLEDKIRFVNRLPQKSRLFIKNIKVLPTYLYYFVGEPDWVILFSKRKFNRKTLANHETFDLYDYREIPGLNLDDYEEIPINIYFADKTRPELDFHSFSEVIPVYEDQVFIYHKK